MQEVYWPPSVQFGRRLCRKAFPASKRHFANGRRLRDKGGGLKVRETDHAQREGWCDWCARIPPPNPAGCGGPPFC